MNDWLLFMVIAVPLLGGIALMFLPGKNLPLIRGYAAGVAGLTALLSLWAFFAYDYSAGGFQFQRSIEWLPVLGIRYNLAIDGISALMVLLTGIVFITGVLISWTIEYRPKDFFVQYLLLVAGVYGVFVSQDLFFFFFFYELAVVPMYLLIAVWGSSTDFKTFLRTKEYGALKLMLMLVAGSVLVWVGILAVYAAGDGASFAFSDLANHQFTTGFQRFFFPFFMIGFGVLAGLFPFHTWSPDGHVAAPTAVSMVHAGVLMKLGAYGVLRSMEILPQGAHDWMPVLIGLGTVNVVYGAVSAMAQRDLKYVIGYSSVSHMGYVLMGIATLDAMGVGGAVLQMFSHGVMTALLFAVVGVIYHGAHTRDIDILQGLAKRVGITTTLFVIAGLSSLGLPGLSGFIAELLVFIGAFRTYPLLAILGVFGAAITAVYILRLMAKVFFGPPSERWAHLHDASPVEAVAAGSLAAVLIIVGILPTYFIKVIDSGVLPFLAHINGG
ncbi:MAG: NADH-quinone oxidoreductase subunit M [Chloroflexi bacterium]|nr:NADH-quinone oxidoreductase subunit M [Chloroflexota bacterium]